MIGHLQLFIGLFQMTAGYGKMLHLPIYPDDSHNQQQGQDTDHPKIKAQTVVLLLLHGLIGKIYERQNTCRLQAAATGIVVVGFIPREANVAVSTFNVSFFIKQLRQGPQGSMIGNCQPDICQSRQSQIILFLLFVSQPTVKQGTVVSDQRIFRGIGTYARQTAIIYLQSLLQLTGAGGFHLFTFQIEGGGRRKHLHQRVSICGGQAVITTAPEGILRIRPQFIVQMAVTFIIIG